MRAYSVMKVKLCVVGLVMFRLLTGPASAAAPEVLNLTQCFRIAVQKNETLADINEQILQHTEKCQQAVNAYSPLIGGSGAYSVSDALVLDQLSAKLTGVVPLFRENRVAPITRQAALQIKSLKAMYQSQAALLYGDIVQAWYQIRLLEADQRLLEQQIALYKARKNELEKRARIGRARKSDILSYDVSLALPQTQLLQIQSQIRNAWLQLRLLTGVTGNISLSESSVKPVFIGQTLNDYRNRLTNRPDLTALRCRIEANQAAQAGLDAQQSPAIDLIGNMYVVKPTLKFAAWDLGIQFVLPNLIPDFTEAKLQWRDPVQSRLRESESLQRQAELAVTRALRKAETDLAAQYVQYESDQEQIALLEKAVAAADQNVAIVYADSQLGQASTLDVIQAMNAGMELKRTLNRARFAFKIDQVKLATLVADAPLEGVIP